MGYCTRCGHPVQPQAAFCTSCGAALQTPPQPPQPLGPGPTRPGSGLGKVLLIAIGAIVLLGALGIAGLVYAGYRAKRAADRVAPEFGGGGPAKATGPAARRAADVCSLLSQDEASQIARVAVRRLERDEASCSYFGDPQEVAAQGEAAAADALARMRSGQDVSPQELAQQAQQFAKGLGAQATRENAGLLLVVRVRWGDAEAQETAYRIAMKAMTAGLPPAAGYGSKLEGVGDRAYLAPMGMALYMVKGDSWVELEGPGVVSRDALLEVARKIASRM